jgi:hypothetical protein
MTEGPFRERRRLDDKDNDSVGSLKKRRSCRNECEVDKDRLDDEGSMHTPLIYFVSIYF